MPDTFDSVVVDESVQGFPEAESGVSVLFYGGGYANFRFPPYGTMAREYALREFSREMHQTLFTSARQAIAKKVAATSWVIEGSRGVKRDQELLQMADFSNGWRDFILKLVSDYITYNVGAFIEIIGPGKPDGPLVGRPIGIANLDPLRCYPTDNPEYPVYYLSRWPSKDKQTWHKLHRSRVYRITDMPSSDEYLRGYGESALNRYIGVAVRHQLAEKYSIEQLSDVPPPGIVTISGLNDKQFSQALQMYENDRKTDGSSVFRQLLRLNSPDPNNPATVQVIPFAAAPTGFDPAKYTETDARLVAAAMGTDPTDVLPLLGTGSGNSGSGKQAEVLSSNAATKTLGDIYKAIERFINLYIIRPSEEFSFEPDDTQADKERAEYVNLWADAVGKMQLPQSVAYNIYSQIDDTVRNALENMNDTDLPDDDVKTDTEPNVVVEPPTQNSPQLEQSPQSDGNPPDMGNDSTPVDVQKEYVDTRDDFVLDTASTFQAFLDGDISRSRFGVIMRGRLASAGRRAMLDGLADGGVELDVLEGEDLAVYRAWLAEQSVYVSQLGANVKDGSTFDPRDRAEIWANKSLNDIYQKGLVSADGNGMYAWRLGPTEHCDTCLKASKQVHRLKDWNRSGVMPQSTDLDCGGYKCQCNLVKTKSKASGKLGRIPRTL